MLNISIASNIKDQVKQAAEQHKKQIAYALVKTVNQLAIMAQAEEKKGLSAFFDNPTPFTVNSVAIKYARKGNPTAIIYIRPLAARYIAPYEYGGKQYLGDKPADLVPIDITANQYGNLPRNTIKRYLNRKDVFLGKVGNVYGLWQRPTAQKNMKGKGAKLANNTGKLRLLVAFADPVNTNKRLNFGVRASAVVGRNVKQVFERELAVAIATAK